MSSDSILKADIEKLKDHVQVLSTRRHGTDNYSQLEKTAGHIVNFFLHCGLGVKNQYFQFKNRQYRNIISPIEGTSPELPPLLIGAHYDGNRGTPGADDNASGVAALLETARLLSQRRPQRPVELVAFTLEEPQTFTHIIRRGSRFFCNEAYRNGARYHGAVILECIGYTSSNQRASSLSRLVGIEMPDEGDFLAVVANSPSKELLNSFTMVAGRAVPSLKVVGHAAPLQGYLLPQLRFSDHSSFWEKGYPAIMLNDTVMFRNPHYHKYSDTPDTLDYEFLSKVATAVSEFAAII